MVMDSNCERKENGSGEGTGSYFGPCWPERGWWGQCLTSHEGRSSSPLLLSVYCMGERTLLTASRVQAGISLIFEMTQWWRDGGLSSYLPVSHT